MHIVAKVLYAEGMELTSEFGATSHLEMKVV